MAPLDVAVKVTRPELAAVNRKQSTSLVVREHQPREMRIFAMIEYQSNHLIDRNYACITHCRGKQVSE